MQHTEACRILGIAPEDTEIEIKRKYRKLMMMYHPDASGDHGDIRVSQEINEAYWILLHNGDGMAFGNLSYDDDGYYYVVNPLLAGGMEQVKVEMKTGTLNTDRRDLNFRGKLDVRISVILDAAAKGEARCNAEGIRELLNEV